VQASISDTPRWRCLVVVAAVVNVGVLPMTATV